jgi:hypothetical protein
MAADRVVEGGILAEPLGAETVVTGHVRRQEPEVEMPRAAAGSAGDTGISATRCQVPPQPGGEGRLVDLPGGECEHGRYASGIIGDEIEPVQCRNNSTQTKAVRLLPSMKG